MCDRLGLNDIVRVGKNSGPVLSRLWTKVHEIFGQRRRPIVLSNAVAWLSMSHLVQKIYSPLSLEVLEKQNKCKSFFDPKFFSERRPQLFYDILLAPFGKVWTVCLSSVCWSPSAKPGNEVECRIYGGWVKTHFQFEAVCGPKFMSFWDDVTDHL